MSINLYIQAVYLTILSTIASSPNAFADECQNPSITVKCRNECEYSGNRNKWEITCTAFDVQTGAIRWENGMSCLPSENLVCEPCTTAASGYYTFSKTKNGHLVSLQWYGRLAYGCRGVAVQKTVLI